MLGWILLLLPIWESWPAPWGRWGPQAFPLIGEQAALYVVDGRRVWQLDKGEWRERWRLPDEARAGLLLGQDTLLLGGLNALYWIRGATLHTLPLSQAGWVYRLTQSAEGIAIQAVQKAFWLTPQRDTLRLQPVSGTWIGNASSGPWLLRQDTLYRWPSLLPVLRLPTRPWSAIVEKGGQLWGLTEQGALYDLSTRQEVPRLRVRGNTGSILFTERLLLQWPERDTIATMSQIYAVQASSRSSFLAVITPTECVVFFLQAPLRWKSRWPFPMTQWTIAGTEWVVWQGEYAFSPRGLQRYPTTLLGATYHQGQWLWATPKGLLTEAGVFWAEKGRYVSTVSSEGSRIAWVVGTEVVIRENTQKYRFRFPSPVRQLLWEGKKLWGWRAQHLYLYEDGRWRTFTLPFQPEEAFAWKESWYFKVGTQWFRVTGAQVRDTLRVPPWLAGKRPLPISCGHLLATFLRHDTLFFLTSSGLIAYKEKSGRLPPLQLSAALRGPALQAGPQNTYTLPATQPYIELSWETQALFLPNALRIKYQVGSDIPRAIDRSPLLLSLSHPGSTSIRLWVEHPWYAETPTLSWTIRISPPWYDTWAARLGALLLLLGGITAIAFLREWSLRRTQQRLAQEKEALLRQTQQQQAQLLQAERMANLGLLAAHIAHEINTPLGVIHTALKEAQEGVSAPEAPLPAETRPTPARFRELRQAWQTAYPALSPLLIQQAALLGYTPDQYPALERWLNNPEHWEKLQKSLSFHQALQRAQEAAERLQARLQAIRTYVRRIAEQPLTQVSLKESLQHTLDFYRPLMRKVEATLEAPAQPLYVEASPARLEQVWANLIQNALQAMPEGGILHIRLQAVGDKAQVLIQDSGKGVPPHLREKIFEPLVTTKAPGEGTGLGLPLCREIVESYGGQLRLLHSEPGYTLFGVELPLASPPLRELDTPRADSGLSEKEKEPTPDR